MAFSRSCARMGACSRLSSSSSRAARARSGVTPGRRVRLIEYRYGLMVGGRPAPTEGSPPARPRRWGQPRQRAEKPPDAIQHAPAAEVAGDRQYRIARAVVLPVVVVQIVQGDPAQVAHAADG